MMDREKKCEIKWQGDKRRERSKELKGEKTLEVRGIKLKVTTQIISNEEYSISYKYIIINLIIDSKETPVTVSSDIGMPVSELWVRLSTVLFISAEITLKPQWWSNFGRLHGRECKGGEVRDWVREIEISLNIIRFKYKHFLLI